MHVYLRFLSHIPHPRRGVGDARESTGSRSLSSEIFTRIPRHPKRYAISKDEIVTKSSLGLVQHNTVLIMPLFEAVDVQGFITSLAHQPRFFRVW